jgi:hypothetical protein
MSNEQKAKLLGVPFGTATGRLRKNLLFSMAQRLGEDTCYRCKARIATVDEFSIEHKEAWASALDPQAKFYDLENIAFSHVSCNVGAGYRNRLYANEQERGRVNFQRYYAKPEKREQFLARKRERYHAST